MKRSTLLGLCAVGGLMLASGVPASAQTSIDEFTITADATVPSGGGNPVTVGPNAGGVTGAGFTRTLSATRTSGDNGLLLTSNAGGSGRGALSVDSGTNGFGVLNYTHTGINLLSDGSDAFEFLGRTDLAATIALVVSSAGGSSTGGFAMAPSVGDVPTFLTYASLVGTADLTAVTGIRVTIDGVAQQDTSLEYIRTRVPPRITETVPEPGALALVLPGLLPLAGVLRRRMKK